jgi:mono/diheme cytochrome c family protein
MRKPVLFMALGLLAGPLWASDTGSPRMNYMLHCSGCHGQDAAGSPGAGVPSMRGAIGHFFKVEGGREFLIQVPGTSQSSLNDAQTAELMNWMLKTFSKDEIPAATPAYSKQEVAQLRSAPLIEVAAEREAIIKRLQAQGIAID